MCRSRVGLAITLCVALATFGASTKAAPRGSQATARPGDAVDATVLYNAGTVALTHDAIGPAVTFLAAAARLEPRAPDIRANLDRAARAAARAAGEEDRGSEGSGSALPLATDEAWWLAAALLAIGAGIAVARAFWSVPRVARWVSAGFMLAGLLLSAWLHQEALEERSHPEAVVIVPSLSVERGPEEPSRAAVLLGAGERVRLGGMRGGLVEVRIGANRIGWAVREGLWRVSDAPRYTSSFEPG